jgi:hypothetical protein
VNRSIDRTRGLLSLILLAVVNFALLIEHASGISPTEPITTADSALRIYELEQAVGSLQSQIELLKQSPVRIATARDDALLFCDPSCNGCDTCATSSCDSPSHFVTYDEGWVIRPRNPVQSPFELKFNLHNQFRYTGFANSVDSFTDNAGVTTPIAPRNDFDINRGRFVFSGYAFDPNMSFYTNIDYNTVARNPVLLLLSWISYRFGDALTLSMGLGKVPGTWEWQVSSRFTLGAERTMATTFFRPSITAGIWAQGALRPDLFYQAMIGDGFNTFSLRAAELDPNLAYSGLTWWEPLGSFGIGFSDLEYHESLSIRLGHGLTYAANDADPIGEPGPEQTVIRLTDGTRLVERGALAPGVTVNQFDLSLYSVHLGLKYRGMSFSTEYFLRWLTSLAGTGPLPVNSIFDHGFFAQGGGFLVPERLELYARGSLVTGDFGTGTAVASGVNWYAGGKRGARFTFDAAYVDDSPTSQNRTGFVAGGSGALFRVQWWHFF